MKTKLIFFSILSFCLAIQIFAKPANKDSGSLQLIKDIQLNLEKEFYSLVIANVNQLEEKYPNSRFMEQANRCKLEALYFLGRKNEAKNLMEDLEFHGDVSYFKGRIFFDEENYEVALTNFFESAKFHNKKSERYFSSLYFSAKSYIYLGKNKESIPLLLSLIEEKGYSYLNGELLFLLTQVFYEEENYYQVCKLYEKTEQIHSNVNEKYLRKILLMTASSYDLIKDSEKAQNIYTKINESYDTEGLELDEFWVRCGIESFNEKDFSDSLRCFEVAKSSKTISSDLSDTILIYEGAIKAQTQGYEQGIKFLEEHPTNNKKYFYMILCAYNVLQKDFSKSIFYGEKFLQENYQLSKSEEQIYFWYSLALLNSNQKEKALEIANRISVSNIEIDSLKAKIQFPKTKQFSKIYEKNANSKIALENYIIENLSFENSTVLTKKNNNKLIDLLEASEYKNYFLGLAYYLESDWNACISFMDEHLKSSQKKNEFAKYYKAYSLFMLQKNEAAYNLFVECSKNLSEKSKFNSLFFASQCALGMHNENPQSDDSKNWLSQAIKVANEACQIPIDENEKLDCIIYLAQLYSSSSNYDKAISLVKPYTSSESKTSLKCLYVLAELYDKAGQIEKAENAYQQLTEKWPNSEIAQESLFLQGKMFYENKNWGESADKFSLYRKSYPKGKYYLQSCYYNALALKNLGNDSLSILLLEECANLQNKTELTFISLVELMNMYRQKGDYENAVNKGTILLKNFPEQAKEKNIKKSIEEITYLASGEDEKTASLLATFSNEGGMKTSKGRNAGFKLGEIYISALSTKQEGFKLLQEFISNTPKNTSELQEVENLAKAYYLLGTYYREKLEYQNASNNFLLSAQYYASFNKDLSSRSLYGAVEAFDCNSNFADSKQTYLTMKEKFPESQWTKRAFSLVSEYLD